MGVIQRQSIKHTLVNYVGVAIGLLSVTLLYTRVPELYGLYQLIFGSSLLVTSIFLLGFNVLAIKFFPRFKDESNGHNGFLLLLLKGGLAGFLFFLLFLPLVRFILLDLLFGNSEQRELFEAHFYFIVPVVFFFIFNNLLLKYISNFKRIVVPTILDQLMIKLVLPLLVILYLLKYIDLKLFFIFVVLNYLLVFLGLILYTKSLGQLHLGSAKGFIQKPLAKEMKSNATFGLLNALGNQLAFRIDAIMVAGLVSISSSGIYAIVHVIIDVITKPAKAITAIANPIISDSWEHNNMQEIESIYKKSSIVLLISGLYIFLGIWLSVDDLFSVLPNSEAMRQGKYVILLLGISKLFDLATSVNTLIIANSKKFKFNFYSMLFLAVFNVIFNLVFILVYDMGMVGAALATLCSLGIFNLLKLFYIKSQFEMQPFTSKTVILLLIAAVSYITCNLLPLDFHPIVNILIRSTVLSIVFFAGVIRLNISDDFNQTLSRYLPFKF